MKLLSRVSVIALAALMIVVFVLRARLIYTLNVNWDEFHFLAQVHSYLRGELSAKLLTFHVHLFGWVTSTSPNEAIQVLHLREAMFACAVVSSLCMAFVGWRLFTSPTAALFAVFVGQSTSYLLDHGASARFDSLLSMLFAIAAALLAARAGTSRSRAASAGVVFAVAVLVSVKVVVLLPALLAMCCWPLIDAAPGERRMAARAALIDVAWFGGLALVAYLVLYAVHTSELAGAPTAARVASTARGASLFDIVTRQFSGEVLPTPDPLVETLRWDVPYWVLFGVGGALAFVGIGAGGVGRRVGIKTLLFALPLGSVALYRNAFPYFYVCLLPAAGLLAGLVALRIEQGAARRTGGSVKVGATALIVALALPSLFQAVHWYRYNSDDQLSEQLRTIDVVHEVFPDPVPYIDRCSMIGSFREVGPFMTTWVLEDYRAAGVPIMAALLERERPHFLLQNIDTLELTNAYSGASKRRLLKEDFFTLRDGFVPHWGPLWVAGKGMRLGATLFPAVLEIAAAGSYRVELMELMEPGPVLLDATSAIEIDGTQVGNGDVLPLAAGNHVVRSAFQGDLILRIASARPPPAVPTPVEPLFTPLRFRTSRTE